MLVTDWSGGVGQWSATVGWAPGNGQVKEWENVAGGGGGSNRLCVL